MSSADIEGAGIDAAEEDPGGASANDVRGPLRGLYLSCLLNALAFALSFTLSFADVSPLLPAIAVPTLLFALFLIAVKASRLDRSDDDARAPTKGGWKCLAVCYAGLLLLAVASVLSLFLGNATWESAAGKGVIATYLICIAGLGCTLLYLFVALCQRCW